ncbi:AAA family ATPase [mine drainage metagenome]|uniref:AAA family ATPase n=1 Tax=mine drainage metagenome TaxID=410659 RepID=T1ARV2_9ZZZZ
MALSNFDRVGKALELLKAGVAPFVEREFKAKYGDHWASSVQDVLSDTRLGTGKSESLNDIAVLLVVMDRKWSEVFRLILGKTERSLVNELLAVRHRWAHQEPFSSDDAYRALDSAARLLTAVSASQAEDVEKMKMELLRVRFDEQARGEKRKSAGTAIETATGGQSQTLARGGDTASGRRERPLPASRIRRRSVAGTSG